MAISEEQKKQILQVRDETGINFSECLKILKKNNWDYNDTIEELKKIGQIIINKREDREVQSSMIMAKIHNNDFYHAQFCSETDFVSRSNKFKDMCQKTIDFLIGGGDPQEDQISSFIEECVCFCAENIKKLAVGKIESKNPYFYNHDTCTSEDSSKSLYYSFGCFLGFIDLEHADEELGMALSRHIVAYKPENFKDLMGQEYIYDNTLKVEEILRQKKNSILQFKLF